MIASAHRSAGRIERAAGHIIEASVLRDQRHFADHALAMNFVDVAAAVGDAPASGKQLDRAVGAVLDADVVRPEPAVDRWVRLFRQIADSDSNGDSARRRNVGKQHCERVEAGHGRKLKQERDLDNGLDEPARAKQPVDKARPGLEQGCGSAREDVALKEMGGQLEALPNLGPGRIAAIDQEARKRQQLSRM